MKKATMREKLIIENEIKFSIIEKHKFKDIYNYLNENYNIIPYKTVLQYDYYYDTEDAILARSGISYRIRYRPQISINLKANKKLTGNIWSRYEYSCKVNETNLKTDEIFSIDCKINRIIKKHLKNSDLSLLKNIAIINTFRTGYCIRFKDNNIFGEPELCGIAFFDKTIDKINGNSFFEFEMESFQQEEGFASPYIFNEFEKIGKYIESKGNRISKKSKCERCTNV